MQKSNKTTRLPLPEGFTHKGNPYLEAKYQSGLTPEDEVSLKASADSLDLSHVPGLRPGYPFGYNAEDIRDMFVNFQPSNTLSDWGKMTKEEFMDHIANLGIIDHHEK